MKPGTFSHTTRKTHKVLILRHDRYYPRGRVVTSLRAGSDPVAYIDRCIAEDKATRLRKVTEYLAERAARPAPVVEPSNQMDLF